MFGGNLVGHLSTLVLKISQSEFVKELYRCRAVTLLHAYK